MSASRIMLLAAVAALAAGCASGRTNEVEKPSGGTAASAVKVIYNLRYDEGEGPGGGYGTGRGRGWYYRGGHGEAGEALAEKRPLEEVGYLLADDLVLTEDPMIEDRFVESIEVEVGGRRVPAVMDSAALENRGVFLRLAAPVANAAPLTFAVDSSPPYKVVGAQVEAGEIVCAEKPLTEVCVVEDSGVRRAERAGQTGPVVDASGVAVGFVMSRRRLDKEAWKGSPLDWPALDWDEFTVKMENVKKAAEAGILQVAINFRARASRRREMYYQPEETPSEMHAAGLLLGDGTVLVLAKLTRRETARIASITARCGEESVGLKIEGAMRDYGIIVAKCEGELEGARPLELWDGSPGARLDALFAADRLDFSNFARDEKFLRGRFTAVEKGFRGLLWPQTSDGGVFMFTTEGALASAPVTLRGDLLMQPRDWLYNSSGETVSMPGALLAGLLEDLEGNLDRGYRVLSEEEAKRLVWLGVETQPLDLNLARANDATVLTKGGEMGALVVHVYEGSPAARAGIESGDVLLRVIIPGQKHPANVRVSERSGPQFPWSQLDQVPDMYFEQLPRPWPSRENDLTKFFTEVGAGTNVSVVVLRDGAEMKIETRLEVAPRDFTSAGKFEDGDLGMTVKNLTYEVRRFLRMDASAPGVVIAEIEPGSKASVAGLKPCEIITAVNAAPVTGVDEFREAIAAGGEVSFTVQRMFQSRVVQVYLEPAEGEGRAPTPAQEESSPQAPAEGEAQADS